MRWPWQKTTQQKYDALDRAFRRYMEGEITQDELHRVRDKNRIDYRKMFLAVAKARR